MDEFLKAAMGCRDITGLVHEVTTVNETLYRQAMGVRDIAKGSPVTNETLFGIGSTTKAFTTVLLAMAIDDGSFASFDAPPVGTMLPGFGLAEAWPSQVATVQDLVSHRTGVPRNDILWLAGLPGTIADNYKRVATFPLNLGFRAHFEYNNWMVASAGALAAHLRGTTWPQLLQERVLDPLGLNATYTSVKDAVATGNYAIPVVRTAAGKLVQLPADVNTLLEPVAPAGIISSTSADMGAWVRFHMRHGTTPAGKRLVNLTSLAATWTPRNTLGQLSQIAAPTFGGAIVQSDYGAGWFIGQLGQDTWVQHGGDSLGHHSLVSMTHEIGSFFSGYGPDENAIALARLLVASFAHDLFAGREPWLNASTVCSFPAPWVPSAPAASSSSSAPARAGVEMARALLDRAGQGLQHESTRSPIVRAREAVAEATRTLLEAAAAESAAAGPVPAAPLPLSAFVGSYSNAGYGDVDVLPTGTGGVYLRFWKMEFNLTAQAGAPTVLMGAASTSPYNLLFGSQAIPFAFGTDASGKTVTNMTAAWMEPKAPPTFERSSSSVG